MNYLFKKIYALVVISLLTFSYCYAAKITIESAPQAAANVQPMVVRVFLDHENDTLSGFSGNFSFPADLFSVESISTENSIVSLWVTQPSFSEEKYLDARTHIVFEGIFPGGYSGVRSPYYKGTLPGVLFSITLIPKNKGVGSFLVDDIIFNSYDSNASPLPAETTIKSIVVPLLTSVPVSLHQEMQSVKNQTLKAIVTRDPLVNNNAWYLMIADGLNRSSVSKIFVAETNDYHAEEVNEERWHLTKNPYVLFYQDRSKYIHVKVVYSNNTYSTVTLQPVENSGTISYSSRILIGIVIVLLLYIYGKHSLSTFRKKI